MHKSLDEFEILPDSTTGFYGNIINLKNGVATFSRLFLMGSFSYLQVMMTYMIHKGLNEFKIRPDPTMDHRVSCP